MENSLFSGVPKFRQSTASLQCAWILGPLKNINFPFETNGKLMILGVPILKHFRLHSKTFENKLLFSPGLLFNLKPFLIYLCTFRPNYICNNDLTFQIFVQIITL